MRVFGPVCNSHSHMYFYPTISINGRQGKGVKLNILLCSYGEQEGLNGLMMSMEV